MIKLIILLPHTDFRFPIEAFNFSQILGYTFPKKLIFPKKNVLQQYLFILKAKQ